MAESITSQRRVFLSSGHKGWTEIKKYGKICIRNDVVKSGVEEERGKKCFGFSWQYCLPFFQG